MTSAALALVLGLLAQSPDARQTPPPQEPAVLEDVEVEGRRLRSVVQDFVGEIGAPAPSRGPARWNSALCVGVVNLRVDLAQYIVDRTSDVARELGVTAGEPGCTPNVLIVAAADGRAVADGVVAARRSAFNPGGSGMNRSFQALEEFRSSEAPIRWWHVSGPVDSDSGVLATRLPGYEAPQINVSGASRLRTDIRDDLIRVIIVLDMEKLVGLSSAQLADYCALVALAQVDPKADLASFDTVLNLFSDAPAPGLTTWDMDYLNALYGVEQNSIGAAARGADIVERMTRRIRAEAEEPTAD